MATEKQPWPDTGWGRQAHKEILAFSMSLTAYAKTAMSYGIAGHRDIPLIREMLQQIQAEARDILLACNRMRLARQSERYRLPNWVSFAIREPEAVDAPKRVTADTISLIENIPILAQEVVELCQEARKLNERPAAWQRMGEILGLCTQAGQRIQEIILSSLPASPYSVLDLVRDVVNSLDDD